MDLKQILEEDGKVDWELFVSRYREYSPLFAYLALSVQHPRGFLLKTIGVDFEFRYVKRVGNEYFHSIKDYTELRNILNREGDKSTSYFTNIIKKAEMHCNNLVKFCNEIRKRKYFGSESNQELLRLFEQYWCMLRNAAALLLVKHNLNIVIEKRIKKRLEEILKAGSERKKAAEYFEKMLIPAKDTLITQANRKLKDLALKNKLSKKEIGKWLAEYNWIETFTWLGNPLTEENIKKKITEIKNKKETKEENQKKEFEKIKEELKLEGEILIEIEALQDLLYLHTYELECLFAAKYWCQNLMTEIGTRIGLSFEEYAYAIYPEIVMALKGKSIDKNRILKRKANQYAIFQFGGRMAIIEGDDFGQILGFEKALEKSKTEVTGNISFMGKVRGKVKIIRTVHDFNKFENGDILISPMTTTDFTPHMHKAKAIVTDEGGITCHASIISRELKIPCIVGTREATKIFKDGDYVEVDANKGIVKKITQ